MAAAKKAAQGEAKHEWKQQSRSKDNRREEKRPIKGSQYT